jgi:hypothetical protein
VNARPRQMAHPLHIHAPMKSVLVTVTIALLACASLAPRVADTPAEQQAKPTQQVSAPGG